MNAPVNIPITPAPREGWAARPCNECDGHGRVWDGKGKGGNDPDSGDVECPDCEGEGTWPCDICGCEVTVAGYDCIVCATAADLAGLNAEQITKLRPIFDATLAELALIKTVQVAA